MYISCLVLAITSQTLRIKTVNSVILVYKSHTQNTVAVKEETKCN